MVPKAITCFREMGHVQRNAKKDKNISLSMFPSAKCLPATKEVLLEHLRAQVRSIRPGTEDIVVLTLADSNIASEHLLKLLCDPQLLKTAVEGVLNGMVRERTIYQSRSAALEELGEQLFPVVARIDSELCAQITGMLLELQPDEIHELLENPTELAIAVSKAKTEYLKFVHQEDKQDIPAQIGTAEAPDAEKVRKEAMGEILYDAVLKEHPAEEASRITGMLLEMDPEVLFKLLSSPEELRKKIQISFDALHFATS